MSDDPATDTIEMTDLGAGSCSAMAGADRDVNRIHP
jgi:hypothetical protein